MPTRLKKNSSPNDVEKQPNGLYVHSSPPKVLQVHSSVIRQWLRAGDIDHLEQLVLQGQGHKLVGEYSPDPKVRAFLRQVPSYMIKVKKVHEAIGKGDLKALQKLLESRRQDSPLKNIHLATTRAGLNLLHEAVFYGNSRIVEFLLSAYPEMVDGKDGEGKTPLHYCGASKDAGKIWPMLVRAGGNPKATDSRGRLATYYMERSNEIQLPEDKTLVGGFSSLPADKNGIIIKPSNIRIWIHDRDLTKLQQVIWEGHGAKLRVETSKHPKVKRFLEGVPYILNAIKDVHSSVVKGDVDEFRKRTAAPIPLEILSSKDSFGLNPLHKAAGLGRRKIAENILQRNQNLVFSFDHEGRTPLHFAAALRDDSAMYNLLAENGADEASLDKNGKAASYYRSNPKEIPSMMLEVIPEAPRTSLTFPQTWDWGLFRGGGLPPPSVEYSALNFPVQEEREIKPSEEESGPESKPPDDELEKEEEDGEGGESVSVDGKPPSEESETSDKTENVVPDVNGMEKDTEGEEEREEPRRNFDIWTNEEDGRDGEEDRADEETQSLRHCLKEEESPADKEEDKVPEESRVEVERGQKTEREIAEERQRLLDEGLVTVSAEDEGRSEEGRGVEEIIERGDMEKLASLVLEGQGDRLLGKTSSNAEIQSFLDNLPTYMAKIAAVHRAARSGSLRDLQAALDRRRFAVARESGGKLGASPLHEAVLFGNIQIVKYLGGRFPETLTLKDNRGRTPLHYAAILQDSGHLYSSLVDLGADENITDDGGHTASYYRENRRVLTRESLLQELGPPSQDSTDQGVGTPVTDPSVHEAEAELSFDEGIPLSKGRGGEDTDDEGSTKFEQHTHFSPTDRDEYGQSVLHFAAARAHGRSGLFQLIHESGVNLGYRDELYRTARDIAVQANIQENVKEIDKYVISLAAKGETGKLLELFLEGYDHILGLEDDEDNDIVSVVAKKNHEKTMALLKSIPSMEEKRERVHRAIRVGELKQVEEVVSESKNGRFTVVGKSPTGRCALHLAVLCQKKDIAEFIAQKFPETLRIGDNLERTPLHYAMGVDDVETLSRTLIKCGAKRVVKDLKGRQPTYYFMNKSEILRLQEEENMPRT